MPDAEARTPPPPADVDPDLRSRIQAARKIWIDRLIDHSRANSLLFYRDLKVGTLDLSDRSHGLTKLLAREQADIEDLLPPLDITEAARRDPTLELRLRKEREELRRKTAQSLLAIQRKALQNGEEKGLDTLFLAHGFATWPALDGGRPYLAPVLLLPAQIESRGRLGDDLRVQLAGEPQVNLVLIYVLQHNHNLEVSTEKVLEACTREDDTGAFSTDPVAAFRVLGGLAERVRGFEVVERAVLGNFQFAKMAMVEDLLRHEDELVAHPMIGAIAGFGTARQRLGAMSVDIEPTTLDDLPSEKEHLVLNADSSQQRVIRLACQGQNGVIQGPPGTGKSQTIANLLAELAANEKRVLFVAEKRAALDAVVKRLRHLGLGHLVLDLHGASVSKKAVMARLADTLALIGTIPRVDGAEHLARLDEHRVRLNAHARRVNTPREPAPYSVYELEGLLLRLPTEARTSVRWRGTSLLSLTPDKAGRLRAAVEEAAANPTLFLGTDPSPWNNAEIRSGDHAIAAVDAATRLADEAWPPFEVAVERLRRDLGAPEPESAAAVRTLATLLQRAAVLLARYRTAIFDADLPTLAKRLEPGSRGVGPALLAYLTDPTYRAARGQARALRLQPASGREMFNELMEAQRVRQAWRERIGNAPIRTYDGATALGAAVKALFDAVEAVEPIIETKSLHALPLDRLRALAQGLAADQHTPFALPRIHALRDQIRDEGGQKLVEDLREHGVDPRYWAARFDHAWLRSSLDHAYAREPDLTTFRGRAHDQTVGEFRKLDIGGLKLAVSRVLRIHAASAVRALDAHPDQADLVRREAAKQARHIGIRKLLARAPDVLTRIAPCWVASPLSVSQLLDGGGGYFDVVIFDEASQVLPEEAVPALYRAKQAVVAGDRHQLPPTTFFATAVEGEDESEDEAQTAAAEAVSGFESILDTLSSFLPNWMLEWHYRSEDERLIAFSNHHIYNDRLVTFPSVRQDDVVRHVLVTNSTGLSGQEESSSNEVEEVVREVIAHAETHPDETLGVIAMGIAHANRLQAALDRELSVRADLDDFFALDREERFFVKNLETVQGDERDAIILSVGYGKSPDGDLPHRFGPLTQATGHRRLNVAITRARRRITVVSSFTHHEVDLSRSGGPGVRLLKAYLEYAASGAARMPQAETAGEVPLNPFEADIKDALEARGLKLRPQFGASKYRIDLVAMHPERLGRPVLAIECDGRAYHSGATARDRDRLRQEQLMRLGWRFHRIWSTDWFVRREEEIDRAVKAHDEAVAFADVQDADGGGAPRAAGRRPGTPPRTAAPTVSGDRRGPPPPIIRKGPIQNYGRGELRYLAEWAMSDGLLRTEDELISDIMKVLGYRRRGKSIVDSLKQAIAEARFRLRTDDRPRRA